MATFGGRTEIAFELQVRVYFQDTDAAGVVFHATYLDFMERARIEWLRTRGFEPRELGRRFQLLFIVRELSIDYLKPAMLDDLVAVTAQVEKMGRVQLTFRQEVRRGDEVLTQASINVACVTAGSLKPMPIPDQVRAAFGEETASGTRNIRTARPRPVENSV